MTKRIVICSGKVNRNGYKVVAEGINTASFIKNPVLLIQHNNTALSIGKMTDLRLEKVEGRMALTGVPDFDMQDPLAVMIANKYNNGYMNSCSMGHQPIKTSCAPEDIEPGQVYETVLETELIEVSITNIPGDRDAVTMTLSNGEVVHELRKLNINHKIQIMDLNKISAQLGLKAEAGETEVLQAIKNLQINLETLQVERVKSLIALGTTNGHITDDNRAVYEALATTNYEHVVKLLSVKPESKSVDPTGNDTGSIVATVKALANKSEVKGDEKLSFDKLSRENPKELLRIKKEEPELYKKLAEAYAIGK